jgi:hypothetical protein
MGSLGEDIAQTVASRLGWDLINREYLLNKIFAPVCSDNELFRLRESAKFFLNERKPGFGSQILFGDSEDALHIRLMAPDENRLERIRREFNCQTQDAEKIMTTSDRKHKRFVSTVYGADLADLSLYDLTINTAGLSVDEVCGTIVALVREKQSRQKVASRSIETETINNLTEKPVFKNPAEIEFAKILDMYHIDWLYEPRTFPIEWDAEGNVIQAFSPDFYLTRFDTYIELTTMNQKYVTQKNRKARKVRELYPGTNIKIVYKKDFQSLIERFSSAGDS